MNIKRYGIQIIGDRIRDAMKARILGTGSYLPERCLTNDDLAQWLDTSDAWIRERTGIGRRYVSEAGTAEMAVKAAKAAIGKQEGSPRRKWT